MMQTVALTILSLLMASLIMALLQKEMADRKMRARLGLHDTTSGWRRFLARAERLLPVRQKDVIESFARAGIYNAKVALWFLPLKLAAALLLGAMVWFLGDSFGIDEKNQQLQIILVLVVIIIIGPDLLLKSMQERRNRKVSGQLPYLLDLMAVCVQTGMTLEAALAYLGQELEEFDRDLAWVMRYTDNRSRVIGLRAALDDLATHFPSNEMRSFVNTLSQNLHHGSSIYDILVALSVNIREIQLLDMEERVGKLAAKMSVPLILLIMFPIVILITAPGVMRLMSHGL